MTVNSNIDSETSLNTVLRVESGILIGCDIIERNHNQYLVLLANLLLIIYMYCMVFSQT